MPLEQKQSVQTSAWICKEGMACRTREPLTQPMDPEKKSLNFIFPTKYVIPESLKFSHWLSETPPFFWGGRIRILDCACSVVGKNKTDSPGSHWILDEFDQQIKPLVKLIY